MAPAKCTASACASQPHLGYTAPSSPPGRPASDGQRCRVEHRPALHTSALPRSSEDNCAPYLRISVRPSNFFACASQRTFLPKSEARACSARCRRCADRRSSVLAGSWLGCWDCTESAVSANFWHTVQRWYSCPNSSCRGTDFPVAGSRCGRITARCA